jgi:RNA polymerase sigma factor (sigma-70 family)
MENAEAKPPPDTGEPIPPTPAAEPAEAVLLQRFVSQRDEAAFAALVQRYGPLVLSVCTRILNHHQDAEDAFQTTFLILARKASSIARRESICSWIYRVAFRVAIRARSARARQVMSDTNLPDVPAAEETPAWVWRDLRPILDEEVNRLPEKYRLPFILCYLEGKTNAQAAAALNCPPGTVMSRLAWARERLRSRLALRGVALSTGILATVLTQHATASAPPAVLAGSTVANALRFTAGKTAEVAARLAGPAEAFLRAMFLSQLRRTGAYVLVVAGAALLVVWLLILVTGMGQPGNPRIVNPGPAARVPEDQTRMQGTWNVERIAVGGQEGPRDGLQVAFIGDTFQLLTPAGPALTVQFALNPEAQPPTFDLYQGPGLFARGLYRLDGDTLLICYSTAGERPRNFDSSVSPQTILYQLKREAPSGTKNP